MFVIAPDGKLAYAGAIDSTPTVDADVVKKSRNYVRAALDDLAVGRRVATPSTKPYGCTVRYGARARTAVATEAAIAVIACYS
jgi:hypothetical protein